MSYSSTVYLFLILYVSLVGRIVCYCMCRVSQQMREEQRFQVEYWLSKSLALWWVRSRWQTLPIKVSYRLSNADLQKLFFPSCTSTTTVVLKAERLDNSLQRLPHFCIWQNKSCQRWTHRQVKTWVRNMFLHTIQTFKCSMQIVFPIGAC